MSIVPLETIRLGYVMRRAMGGTHEEACEFLAAHYCVPVEGIREAIEEDHARRMEARKALGLVER